MRIRQPGQPKSRPDSVHSTRSASQEPFIPKPPTTEMEVRLAQLTSPFETVSRSTQNRLKGAARKCASRIDVWTPSSANFGSNSPGHQGWQGATRRDSDVPFRARSNPAHVAKQLRINEFWDPYSCLQQPAATPQKPSLPFGMGLGLGQTWKSKRAQTPDPAKDPANKTLGWLDPTADIDIETRRSFGMLLDRCSRNVAMLFKRMCACDGQAIGGQPGVKDGSI